MTMQADVVRVPGAVDGLTQAWRELAVAQGNAFLTPEWYGAYERHYGHEAPPFVVRVRTDDGTLAGLFPLCRVGGTLRFAGANVGDRFGPLATPGREAEVARAAAGVLRREALVLHHVDAGAPWLPALVGGLPRRAVATRLRGSVLPFVTLDGHTWDSFLASRSRNFRSQVRRKERALLDRHAAQVRTTTDPATVSEDIATFFRLHEARWAGRVGGSTITSPAVAAFHVDFATAALARGWLRLSFLETAGEAVAALYAWRIGDRYAYFQAGFDPAWAPSSVGLVLMAHTVRAAIEEGAGEYDLLLGDEEYKARFATDDRAVETVVVTGPLDRTRVMAHLETGVRRVTDGFSPEMRARFRDAAGPVLSRLPGTRVR